MVDKLKAAHNTDAVADGAGGFAMQASYSSISNPSMPVLYYLADALPAKPFVHSTAAASIHRMHNTPCHPNLY